MPNGLSASSTALTTAGVEPIVASSPIPFAPSGFSGEGVSVRAVSYSGRKSPAMPSVREDPEAEHHGKRDSAVVTDDGEAEQQPDDGKRPARRRPTLRLQAHLQQARGEYQVCDDGIVVQEGRSKKRRCGKGEDERVCQGARRVLQPLTEKPEDEHRGQRA